MKKILNYISSFLIFNFIFYISAFGQESNGYVKKGWSLRGAKNYAEAHQAVKECIEKYSAEADKLAKKLTDFPAEGKETNYQAMNDVAECYFIKAEVLRDEGKLDEDAATFQVIVDKYPFAQAFDPRGWFWKIAQSAVSAICDITGV